MLYEIFKRIIDILISLAAMVILGPLMLFIIIAVRLDSSGPVLFRQQRAGRFGRPFVFYKLRTMRLDAEPFGPSPKSGQDARLTRLGRFLREYSLDELPQFFNVLKGDMSIVGPRPLYVSQIEEWNQQQTSASSVEPKKRLLVKPGLTGLAQISGRAALTIEEKLELDIQYVKTAGFVTDLKIILLTFVHLLGKRDIYEKRYSEHQYTRETK
jgi:lipopolysaccharide/colanic/teichoic acid biosynthesis glycosyltransferase